MSQDPWSKTPQDGPSTGPYGGAGQPGHDPQGYGAPGLPDQQGYPGQPGYPAPQGYPDQQGYPSAQGYGPPQPYGAPGWGGQPAYPAAAPPTNTLAIIALVMAFVFSPAAIVLGVIARKQIRETGESGDGLALAGLILGVAFTVIAVVLVVIWVIAVAALVGYAGTVS